MRWIALLFTCGLLPAQDVAPDPQDIASLSPDSKSLAVQTFDPQNLQERWASYIEKTYSWKRISVVAAETAFDQSFQFRKCGRPPYCFPHEIGGALTRRTARTTMELAAGALLHEDLRRRPSNLTGFRQRVSYALLHAPLARDRNGDWRPAYSRFAGTLGAVAVTSAWEGRPLTPANLSEHFGLTVTNYFQDALWTEFEPDVKRMGHRVANRLRGRHK